MKCVFFICESRHARFFGLPSGFTEIYNEIKRYSEVYGLHGMFAYRKKYYIKILEGDSRQVDKFLVEEQDHDHFKKSYVLVSTEPSALFFSQWPMKLVTDLSSDREFLQFYRHYQTSFAQLPKEEKKVLNSVIDFPIAAQLDDPNKNRSTVSNYEDSILSLEKWPEFPANVSIPFIELCAVLHKKSRSYQDLLDSGLFESELELLKSLNILRAKEVLLTKRKPNKAPEKKQSKLFNKMFYRIKDYIF